MSSTRYSIIGSGYFIKLFDSNHPLYKKLKEVADEKTAWLYLSDDERFKTLGLKDSKGELYDTFWQVRADRLFPVYAMDIFTRLEIKPKNDKAIKFMFRDIEKWNTLLPHEFIIKPVPKLSNPGLMIIEEDKGHFGSTTHPFEYSPKSIYTFETMYIPDMNTTVISKILVDNHEVILKRHDTANTGTSIFLK